MEILESKSAENIKKALYDESFAVVQYLLAARKARDEGREDIAQLFDRMTLNELEHAHIWYKHLYGELKDLKSLLQDSAQIENKQWKNSYPLYAKIAKEENLDELAETFTRIAAIENAHERDFTEAFLRFDKGQVHTEKVVEKQAFVCFLCGKTEDTELETCSICGAENPFIPVE